jgi:TnpA family transposase
MYHGRFFEVVDFRHEDINFIAKQLHFNPKHLAFHQFYIKQVAYKHREQILAMIHWKPFDENVFNHQVTRLVEQQLLPRKILWETRSYLFRQKIEAPAYDKYLRNIGDAMTMMGKRVNETLKMYLKSEHCKVLDEFLVKKGTHYPAEIIQYRTISQSTRPKSIKQSLSQFNTLKDRFDKLKILIEKVNLPDVIIDYHAQWASISDTDKIEGRSDKYLFLLCFLIRQVRLRHDFLIDIVLQCVKAAENQAKNLQQEEYFKDQRQRKKATELLINSRQKYRQQVEEIKSILKNHASDSDKIIEIQNVLETENELTKDQEKLITTIEVEINLDERTDFYRHWEKSCTWLSNRINHVINNLIINAGSSDTNLYQAIKDYTAKNGKITSPADNLNWLDSKQRDLLWVIDDSTGKEIFQVHLYKMFLYQAINDGIKSGTLNFDHSYRYRFLEEYLISKQEWKENKEQLLIDAEMFHMKDYNVIKNKLEGDLDKLYHQVNENYNLGLNPYLKFDKNRKIVITTPPVEKPDLERVAEYFKPAQYVSILNVLSDIEKAAPFLHHIGHQSKTHERKRPAPETFFAAIIALGCNIGVERMGNISRGIQSSSLRNTNDWYLTGQALQDANDAIIKIKNELALPDLHLRNPRERHTASDGQKYLLYLESLNASHSYKYPGFSKAVVVNTAVDEKSSLFFSTVVTASDREAINVIDMHLGNPVIKSTIHSTDTHGSTEVVFAMMHMLDISFAPRIKDIGTQELYSFVNRKKYIDLGYQVLPDHYINNQLIEDNWDDILRLMVSLKLGKTSAFQLLKRLNSYAKQNPLQKAMKEFGKITRTSFILRYYDDLELRQSIEKLLSHIELMNRFSKAVFFGNNQEFQVATKDEQEKIILCRRLIQNSIVLWNYLYLSNLLTDYQSRDELEELIEVVRNGTAVTWQHINMLGEYDFNTLQFNQSSRFDMPKLKAWKYRESA